MRENLFGKEFKNKDLEEALAEKGCLPGIEGRGRVTDSEFPTWCISCNKQSFCYQVELWYDHDLELLKSKHDVEQTR